MLSRVVIFLLACELALSPALVAGLDRPPPAVWSSVLNPQPFQLASMWQERPGFIIAVLAVVAVQSAVIAGLLVYHAALRGAKRELAKDIAERQRAQLEMRQLQDEIAHVGRVSMMGQLASSLAHEINQPLGAILRNAEAAALFLECKNPGLEESRAILADIRADDQRAGSVIDRMRS